MTMDELVGLIGILIVALLTLVFARQWPRVAKIMYVAFIVRVFVIVLGNFLTLPDTTGDSVEFLNRAAIISQSGLLDVLSQFPGFSSYFISWILALVYSITGYSKLFGQSLSLFFGISTVFAGLLLAKKLWGERIAIKAGWALALFPTLILYSTIVLREAYIVFFFLVALHGVVDWTRFGGIKSFIITIFGFIISALFHEGMIFGLLIFLGIILKKNFIYFIKRLKRWHLKISSIAIIIIAIFSLNLFISGTIKLPRISGVSDSSKIIDIDTNKLLGIINYTTFHRENDVRAAYPDWLVPQSLTELIYKTPVRIIYFLASPFPWTMTGTKDLVGVLDGFLYIYLIFLLWQNRKEIWDDPSCRTILYILFFSLLIFAIIVGNYGTAIRHRAKFVVVIIMLVAPMLPKLIFSKKYKK